MKKRFFLKFASLLVLSVCLFCGCRGGGESQSDTDAEAQSEFVLPEISDGTDIFHRGFGENEKFVVVIDAGHQREGMYSYEPIGPNSEQTKIQVADGTQGRITNIPEYELNLSVSLALRDELLRRGYTVVMVRETHDVKISNMQRALLANGYEPSEQNGYAHTVNIRIHANASEDESARGALVCHPSFFNPYPIRELYDECRALSKSVLEAYSEESGIPIFSNGYLPTDEMTGTNFCEIPTTILEMGFMSNSEDDNIMASDEFKLAAARGISNGLEQYFDKYTGDDSAADCDTE